MSRKLAGAEGWLGRVSQVSGVAVTARGIGITERPDGRRVCPDAGRGSLRPWGSKEAV